jgi:hypothetical protein
VKVYGIEKASIKQDLCAENNISCVILNPFF